MQSVFSTKDDSGKLSDLQVTVDQNRIRWRRTTKDVGSNGDISVAGHQLVSLNNNNNNDDDDVISPTESWVAEVSLVSSDDEEGGLPAGDDVSQLTPDGAADPASGSGNDVSENGDDIVFVASVVKTPIKTPDNDEDDPAETDGPVSASFSSFSSPYPDRPSFSDSEVEWQPTASSDVVDVVADRQKQFFNGVKPSSVMGSPSAGDGDVVANTASAVVPTELPPHTVSINQVCLRERKANPTKQQTSGNAPAAAVVVVAVVNGSPRLSPLKQSVSAVVKGDTSVTKRVSRDLFNGDRGRPALSAKRASARPAAKTGSRSGGDSGASSEASVLDSPRRILPPTRWVMLGGDVSMVTSKRNVSPVAATVAVTTRKAPNQRRKKGGKWRNGLVPNAKKKKLVGSVVNRLPSNPATHLAIGNVVSAQQPPQLPCPSVADTMGAVTPPPSTSSCSGEAGSPFAPVGAGESGDPTVASSASGAKPQLSASVVVARAERAKLSAALRRLCPGKKKVSCELRDIYEHSVNSAKLEARVRAAPSSSRSTSPRSVRSTPPGEKASWWNMIKDLSALPRTKRVPVLDTAATKTSKKSKLAKTKPSVASPLPTAADEVPKVVPAKKKFRAPPKAAKVGDDVKTKKTKTKEAGLAVKKKAMKVAVTARSTRESRLVAAAKIKAASKRTRCSKKTSELAVVAEVKVAGKRQRSHETTSDLPDAKRRRRKMDDVSTKSGPVKTTTVKKERESVKLQQTAAVRHTASTSSSQGLPNAVSVVQVVVRKGCKPKEEVGATFKRFIADSFQSVVSPVKSPPSMAMTGAAATATAQRKVKPGQGPAKMKLNGQQAPSSVNVRSLLKAADVLQATLSTPGRTSFLSVPTGKEAAEPARGKGPKRRPVKEEKPVGKKKLVLKDTVKRSSKKLGRESGLEKISFYGSGASTSSSVGPKRKTSDDGERLRFAPSSKSAAGESRLAPAQFVYHHHRYANGYGEAPLTNQQAAMKRSSVRQAECATRYREIGVKRHSNFLQIVLISNTRVRNGLNVQVLLELQSVLQMARTDPNVRVVVLGGSGGVFCSGVDLISLSNDQSSSTAEKMSNAVRDFCKALLTFPKPLVAAVNGSAVGLGVTFLPFFDIVYASDKATFYTPYCKLGQIPECGATITFPSIMGYARTNGMLLEGQRLTAAEALGTGLITQVLWPATFMEEVIPRVHAIANYPFDAVLHTKALVRYHALSKLEVTLDTECRVLFQQWSTEECRQSIRNFLQYEEVV